MSLDDLDDADLAKWDPGFIETARRIVGPVARFWFRAEVRGLELLPQSNCGCIGYAWTSCRWRSACPSA